MLYVHRDCIFHIFKQRWQNITHQYKFIQHFMLKQTNVKRELCGFQTMADKASDDGRLNTFTRNQLVVLGNNFNKLEVRRHILVNMW